MFLTLVMVFSLIGSANAVPVLAEEQTNAAVKVGWYETPIDWTDQFGRKNGYNYEHQTKVASYTG